MARIEINLPLSFGFSTQIPVRISDVNQGIHVGYGAITGFLSEARVQYLTSRGCEDQEIVNHGLGFMVVDLGIIYKSQAYYGQTLRVEIAVAELKSKGFDLIYKITDSQSGAEIVRAKTGHLMYDYNAKKVIPIPEEIKRKLTNELKQ
jgi:acyl-CoA thioester hydrolase